MNDSEPVPSGDVNDVGESRSGADFVVTIQAPDRGSWMAVVEGSADGTTWATAGVAVLVVDDRPSGNGWGAEVRS